MGSKHIVRVGIRSARELELEVNDPAAVRAAFDQALQEKAFVLWITDVHGHRFGIATDAIAFIEIEEPLNRGIGFGT